MPAPVLLTIEFPNKVKSTFNVQITGRSGPYTKVRAGGDPMPYSGLATSDSDSITLGNNPILHLVIKNFAMKKGGGTFTQGAQKSDISWERAQ